MKTYSVLILLILLAGCRGTPTPGEKEARRQVKAVAGSYRPEGHKPELPVLTSQSSLSNYLTYALLNQPQVEAAYFDWLASVEGITVARSLPDPQLTFQMDIQDVVTSLMPGLMMSFPGMGKLRVAGAVAAAASQVGYFAFKGASLASAYEVKRTYYRLYFLEEKSRVNRENLGLLRELERLARSQNEVGKATLQDVLRAQIEQERLNNELVNLEDSRGPLLAQWKAALGLGPNEPVPPVPERFEPTPLDVPADKWLEEALSENTRLKAIAAEVQTAEANIRLAYKARMPDTSVGFMADAKMSPVLYRPWGTVSIPLWRDKLAAQVAEAQANKRAGEARLTAEQINLAVDVADLAGQADFLNLAEAEQTLLRFNLDEVDARTQRELALAELSLIVQGMPPAGRGAIGMEISSAGMGAGKKIGGSTMGGGASSGAMGSGGGGMLPGNSAPPSKKMNQGAMNQ